jgi:mitogen-activated protein kinase kinase
MPARSSGRLVDMGQIIRVDAKENVRKQIVRELQVGHDCNSPNIVTFYGAFQNEARDIVLCMEYMDCGYVYFLLGDNEIVTTLVSVC